MRTPVVVPANTTPLVAAIAAIPPSPERATLRQVAPSSSETEMLPPASPTRTRSESGTKAIDTTRSKPERRVQLSPPLTVRYSPEIEPPAITTPSELGETAIGVRSGVAIPLAAWCQDDPPSVDR